VETAPVNFPYGFFFHRDFEMPVPNEQRKKGRGEKGGGGHYDDFALFTKGARSECLRAPWKIGEGKTVREP